MSKRATIIIDLQNDYLSNGKMPLHGIDAAVARAAQVIARARERGEPVIHVRHEFTAADAPFFVAGSAGSQIIDALAPAQGETVITKNYPNAFRETNLNAHLRDQDITDVVVVGAMSHMCIDASVRAASDLGYRVTVIEDACAAPAIEFRGVTTPAEQVHATQMAALAFAYADVVTAEEHVA